MPPKRQAWKTGAVSVDVKPDHLYGPKEVKTVLGVSCDTNTTDDGYSE